jgi:hypothetical protein
VQAVNDTSSPNATTTDRKERRAKAKEKAKKMAEGKKKGAAYAAPPGSPDSQSSGGEEDGSSEPSETQQLAEDEASEGKEDTADGMINEAAEAEAEVRVDQEALVAAAIRKEKATKKKLEDRMQELTQQADDTAARLAAADDAPDRGDTKEAGETGAKEQEAEEKDGEVRGQAGPAPLAGESGGGCAYSFSFSGGDRAHHSFRFPSPKRERKMSDEEQQEEGKRFREKSFLVKESIRLSDSPY